MSSGGIKNEKYNEMCDGHFKTINVKKLAESVYFDSFVKFK